MGIILDLVIVLIFIFTVVISTNQGFFRSAVEFGGGIAAYFLSFILAKPVGVQLTERVFAPLFRKRAIDTLSQLLNSSATKVSELEIESLLKTKPGVFRGWLAKMNVTPEDVQAAFSSGASTEESRKLAMDAIISPMARDVGQILGFFAAFILIVLLIKIVLIVLHAGKHLPVLHSFNTPGGFAMGLLKGVLYTFVFCMLMHAFLPYTEAVVGIGVTEDILTDTKLFAYFDKYNFLKSVI